MEARSRWSSKAKTLSPNNSKDARQPRKRPFYSTQSCSNDKSPDFPSLVEDSEKEESEDISNTDPDLNAFPNNVLGKSTPYSPSGTLTDSICVESDEPIESPLNTPCVQRKRAKRSLNGQGQASAVFAAKHSGPVAGKASTSSANNDSWDRSSPSPANSSSLKRGSGQAPRRTYKALQKGPAARTLETPAQGNRGVSEPPRAISRPSASRSAASENTAAPTSQKKEIRILQDNGEESPNARISRSKRKQSPVEQTPENTSSDSPSSEDFDEETRSREDATQTPMEEYHACTKSTPSSETAIHLTNTGRICRRLKDRISEPLGTKKELALGEVYIMRDPDRAHLLKIGFSDRDPYKRMKEIKRKCGHDIELVSRFTGFIAQAKRAEQLIHIELESFKRMQKVCCNLKKGHGEWFEVEEAQARKVVARWTRFIQQSPYDESGNLADFWTKRLEYFLATDDWSRFEETEDLWERFTRPTELDMFFYRNRDLKNLWLHNGWMILSFIHVAVMFLYVPFGVAYFFLLLSIFTLLVHIFSALSFSLAATPHWFWKKLTHLYAQVKAWNGKNT